MKRLRSAWQARGFSLVEVAMSLGLAAFCLVAVFALLPLGLSSNQQSSEETLAVNILSAVVSDLKSTPAAVPPSATATSLQMGITIPVNPVVSAPAVQTRYFSETGLEPAGGMTLQSTSRYRLDVSFLPNGANGSRAATLASLKVSWPAPSANPVGEVEMVVALDRN